MNGNQRSAKAFLLVHFYLKGQLNSFIDTWAVGSIKRVWLRIYWAIYVTVRSRLEIGHFLVFCRPHGAFQ